MKRTLLTVVIVSAACTGAISVAHAQDGVDKAKAMAFDARMFALPRLEKTYACFVRRYDANHLAQHPKQKVGAMKLLVAAEDAPEDKTTNYSFRLGIKYRHRSGDFDSSGYCNHTIATDAGNEARFECGVDCEGGGVNVALSRDDKSAIVRLQKIVVWNRNKPDDEASDALFAGADDRIFRVDRADASECAELVTDRKELAALRHK
ncbi:hypothetical protein ACFFWD_25170 [Bradyrhizobium erythrophlei]|uniref:hypothetical protein n=1 Tax=Bradyrhizobium erythrophlei TaxID=1437360 RepID=UPI0035EC87D6